MPSARNKKLVYGLLWNSVKPELEIEFEMIRRGGQWVRKENGKTYGNGILFHWQRAKALIWPEHLQHRWDELRAKCFLEYDYVGEMGCAAGGKSDSAATNFLLWWYLAPYHTTVLVSSTDIPSLELRVWGMIKKYHRAAKERWPWLDGYLIEGKRMITLDPRTDCEEGRDFRNGIIAVPCFSSGTMVDTVNGPIPIEKIQVNQQVYNAVGVGRVYKAYCRISQHLLRVTLSDGRCVDCTPEHPFFTSRGWVKAIDLETFDMVLSPRETMSIMRHEPSGTLPKPEVLPELLEFSHAEDVRQLREAFSSYACLSENEEPFQGTILQQDVREFMGSTTPECATRDPALRKLWQADEPRSPSKEILFNYLSEQARSSPMSLLRPGFSLNKSISKEAQKTILQSILCMEWNAAPQTAQGYFPNTRGANGLETVSKCDMESSFSDGFCSSRWQGSMVQAGCGFSGFEVGCRNRRWSSSDSWSVRERSSENPDIGGTRVDRVEVLESRGDPRFSKSEGGYRVYNLEVEGHPSYSVNGMLVHNCKKGSAYVGMGSYVGIHNKCVGLLGDELNLMPRAFLDSTSNLSKAETFKMGGLGNPSETTSAHGALCEPAPELGGWEGGIDQTAKTKTWKTRFPNGICIQTPGTDSPNMDDPPEAPVRYPFLITRQQIENDAQIWGRDDWHFTMMVDGKMPRGQGSRRVITRAMCERGRALEAPIWRDSRRTRIGFLDAAYRGVGGDRCVFGELQFGYEAESLPEPGKPTFVLTSHELDAPHERQIIALIDLIIIPITGEKGAEEPEDQIVKFVMAQCDNRGIPPENFAFDAGMRTSLVTAFARLWSANVESLDSMGRPDDRRVSANIDVKCCDYYSNRVTQFWYDVRHCIEAQQMRGLTEEAMREGCIREFKMVKGNKIEVETKADMKVKSGRSPDLFDALCLTAGTMIKTPNGFVAIETLKVGDEVDTPFGPSLVAITHASESDDISEVKFSNGRSLTGTSGHKIFTWDDGWVRMDGLSFTNQVESVHNAPLWRLLNMLFTRVEHTGFKALVDTIKTKTGAVSLKDFYTELSGVSTMGIFLKACASIIKIMIGAIIGLRTWNSCPSRSMPRLPPEPSFLDQAENDNSLPIWTRLDPLRPSGMVLKLVQSGTLNMGKLAGLTESQSLKSANFAENLSRRLKKGANFAQMLAALNLAARDIVTLIAGVLCAVPSLLRFVTTRRGIAPVNVRRLQPKKPVTVYNLTLEEHNAYYANDILVQNCYGLHLAQRRGFVISKIGMLREILNPEMQQWKRDARDKAYSDWHSGDLEFAS